MNHAAVFAVAAMMLSVIAMPCRAEGDVPQPYQLMRALQSLQNDAAAGKPDARAAQPKLVGEIAAIMQQTGADTWRDRRNASAAALFLLSGGPASAIRRASGASVFAPTERPLINGALAYAEGREAEAKRLLLPIDALRQPEGVGGPLALVQAALVMHEEPQRALALLDRARLLSPGTLIEEAALRRSVFIADETNDAAAFMRFAKRYKRRFPGSIYAGAVERRILPVALRFAERGGAAGDEVLSLLGPEARLDLRLSIARKALLKADFAKAGAQADLVVHEARAGSAEAMRAALYGAVSQLLNRNAVTALETLDRRAFSPEDVDLLDAALSVKGQLHGVPSTIDASAAPSAIDSAVMTEARAAISMADALLGVAP